MQENENGEWRMVYKEERRILYYLLNIIRVVRPGRSRWAEHVARIEGRRAFKILTGKPTGRRPLGKLMRRW